MLARLRLAMATPARPFAVAGSCRMSHSSPSSDWRSSAEARTSCIARMSTLRPASQSPMPLRNAARTPLTLTLARRRGFAGGMPPILREASDLGSRCPSADGCLCAYELVFGAGEATARGNPCDPARCGDVVPSLSHPDPRGGEERQLLPFALLGGQRLGGDVSEGLVGVGCLDGDPRRRHE